MFCQLAERMVALLAMFAVDKQYFVALIENGLVSSCGYQIMGGSFVIAHSIDTHS